MDTKAFLAEIVAVCRRHKMVITTSDYDHLQVWRLEDCQDAETALEEITDAEDRTDVFTSPPTLSCPD